VLCGSKAEVFRSSPKDKSYGGTLFGSAVLSGPTKDFDGLLALSLCTRHHRAHRLQPHPHTRALGPAAGDLGSQLGTLQTGKGEVRAVRYWPDLVLFFFPAFWRGKKSSEFSCASLAPIKKSLVQLTPFEGRRGGGPPTPTYMYRNHLK
jgi:hypothetical protein